MLFIYQKKLTILIIVIENGKALAEAFNSLSLQFENVQKGINSSQEEGVYQGTSVKVLIGAEELGDYYPTQADRIQYTRAGSTVEGKITSVTTYRGDEPVYHSLIVRIQ